MGDGADLPLPENFGIEELGCARLGLVEITKLAVMQQQIRRNDMTVQSNFEFSVEIPVVLADLNGNFV